MISFNDVQKEIEFSKSTEKLCQYIEENKDKGAIFIKELDMFFGSAVIFNNECAAKILLDYGAIDDTPSNITLFQSFLGYSRPKASQEFRNLISARTNNEIRKNNG